MNFEEWYAKLGEWAEENTALNMSYAMQRHLASRLEEWEASRPTQRALDAADVCRVINHFYVDGVCSQCGSIEPLPVTQTVGCLLRVQNEF